MTPAGTASRYRLLVTDLDGTLLGRRGGVHPSDRRAINELQRRRVQVSILTGRLYSGTREIAHSLGVSGPIGCVDGSHIVDASTDRDLLLCTIAPAAATSLCAWLREADTVTFLLSGDTVVHDPIGEPYLPYLTLWTRRTRAVRDVLDEASSSGPPAPTAVITIGERDPILDVRDRIDADAAGALQAAAFSLDAAGLEGLWAMMVRASGPSKATAVDWIARHHGLIRDEIVAVGDWYNDVPMLQAAGRSFAMGQAPPEVKAAATDRLRATVATGGGITEAAERAGLL